MESKFKGLLFGVLAIVLVVLINWSVLSLLNFPMMAINIINQYEDDYVAFVDENTIRIVLRNILHNAIKFSPNNSELRIVISEENKRTKINIVDCGCGFSVNHNSQGMGLGLELCKEFIEINNGELMISSSESGSSVMVVIPCSKI